ncbi:MAG TPA: tetratricopeptide repeat protein [candidate division Zixibacteria bacterium]|nr:tetratricopeptide repeat protein [candidate division Zixibacteria bacterium]
MKKSARLRDLAAISTVALLYRAAHLFFWSRTPYFSTPTLDELYHHVWAGSVAGGNLRMSLPFFRAPLYPYMLGGIYAIFGDGPWPPRIVQGIIGIVACCLVYVLAIRVSGSRRAGIVAGMIIALSPMPALFESRLLLDFLLVPLGALVLILLIDAVERRPFFSILPGISIGLFALARPNILAVFPFLIAWLIWVKGKRFKISGEGIKNAVLLILGLVLAISPAMVHNLSRGSRAPIATQGGLNLYLGNNPQTDGITPILPGHGGDWTLIDAWRDAETETSHCLSFDELDRFYRNKAIRWGLANPQASLKLLGRKVLLLLSGIEHGNNGSPEFFKTMSPPLYSSFAWRFLLPVALLFLPLLRWNRRLSLMAIFFLAYSATVVLFFVNARFRLPLMVPLAVFVSMPLGEGALLRTRPRYILAGALFIAGLLVCTIFPAGKLGARGMAESYFALGNLHLRNGETARADSLYSLALETSPGIDRANLNRGIIAFREGDLARAREFFAEEARLDGGKRELALSNLGVVARISADTSSALDFGARSITDNPNSTAPYINFAQSLLEFGMADSAIAVAMRGLDIDSLNVRLLNIAGAGAIETGDFARARGFLERAINQSESGAMRLYELGAIYSAEAAGAEPESAIVARAHYNLAVLEAREGNADRAMSNLHRAVRISPNLADAHIAMGTIYENSAMPDSALASFERAIELGALSAGLYYNLGLVKAQMGRWLDARDDFRSALDMDSTFAPAMEKLDLIRRLADDGEISLE